MIGPNLPAEQTPPQIADAPSHGAPALPPVAVAPQLPPVTIAVVGDSLSVFLAQGLQDIYAERPGVTFLKRNRESSGLVRNDYYDWPKQLRDLIATSPKLDALVVQIGTNDRQQLKDDTGTHEPRSDRWKELYARRIDEIAAIAREKKIPLIWVGLPTMRGERYSADMLVFNEMFKARSQQAGAAFIDVWEAFSGETGGYTVNGPDVDGTIVRLRTADGVHFTRAGSRKLAWFVDKELQKIVAGVQEKAPQPGLPAAISIVPGSGVGSVPGALPNLALPSLPEPPLPTALRSNDALLGVALPDAPLPSPLRPRPEAGPAERLSAPPSSAGGALLSVRDIRRSVPEGSLQGRSGPKPGRSDDFRVNP